MRAKRPSRRKRRSNAAGPPSPEASVEFLYIAAVSPGCREPRRAGGGGGGDRATRVNPLIFGAFEGNITY
nr:hypothetical protein [Gammaproteobacteria bacterium]